jgi:molecular chaperone GrpE
MSDQEHKEKEMEKDIPRNEMENESIEETNINENVVQDSENEQVNLELEEVKEELSKEKNNFLRLFAEFENYKKRTSKERIELFSTANKELMTVLLPILDDFERGLKEIEKSSDVALL